MRWTARLRAAERLQKLDDTDGAVKLLDDMKEERPERADALIELGDLYRAAKRYADAADAYGAALARIPKLEDRHWSIYYARAVAYDKLDRWPEAEADLKKALELSPDQGYVLNYLAYSWVDRGMNLDKAKAMIQRAVELRPTDGYIVDSLGWVLYRLGDYGGAVQNLERAVELKPADPTINDHLGDAFWQAGRLLEARFQWQRALKSAEDDKQAQEIQAKLDKGLVQKQTAATAQQAPAP
jgi:tetratricopeptide (TPR) repeat protein